MFAEMRAISELEGMAGNLGNIVAGDRTFLSVARHLMKSRPTDVSIVYLRGVDTASHKFWAAAHPGEVGFPVSQTEARVFGSTVERYYEYADEMLGLLVDEFGEGNGHRVLRPRLRRTEARPDAGRDQRPRSHRRPRDVR